MGPGHLHWHALVPPIEVGRHLAAQRLGPDVSLRWTPPTRRGAVGGVQRRAAQAHEGEVFGLVTVVLPGSGSAAQPRGRGAPVIRWGAPASRPCPPRGPPCASPAPGRCRAPRPAPGPLRLLRPEGGYRVLPRPWGRTFLRRSAVPPPVVESGALPRALLGLPDKRGPDPHARPLERRGLSPAG